MTEHLGGTAATRRLADWMSLNAGHLVLEVGCGTGYTACLVARETGAGVVGIDLSGDALRTAARRAAGRQPRAQTCFVRADAERMPFRADTFDGIVVESVLIHCNPQKALAECTRSMTPRGLLGSNEMVLREPVPEELSALLTDLGVSTRTEPEWRRLLADTGLSVIRSQAFPFQWHEQLSSHIEVDGWVGYALASIRGLGDVRLLRPFLNMNVIRGALRWKNLVRYALMLGERPSADRLADQGLNGRSGE